ncbi:hypothetical protein GCM10010206_09320 [Streptomyces cinerochromogenes]|nr:RcpC/CpaB family pilus assembly protein [Streptomyces cinerochromogenes]GGS49898.1 hypothetical protein GCM10010206_09320 [Streptomyces cinerochromogenes]
MPSPSPSPATSSLLPTMSPSPLLRTTPPPAPITPSSPPSPLSPTTPSPSARSPFPPPLRLPRPLGTDAPPTREVPPFDPVRVCGGRYRLQRLVRHRRRAVVVGLAVTAAALVAAGPRAGMPGVTGTEPHGTDGPRGHPAVAEPARGHPDAGPVPGNTVTAPVRRPPAADVVSAPVRIADAATVRLLRPGDRVDVIAAADPSAGRGEARVLARGVRVTTVPEMPQGAAGAAGHAGPDAPAPSVVGPAGPDAPGPSVGAAESGALVVLAVPRATAARLVGAGATARLAVTLC